MSCSGIGPSQVFQSCYQFLSLPSASWFFLVQAIALELRSHTPVRVFQPFAAPASHWYPCISRAWCEIIERAPSRFPLDGCLQCKVRARLFWPPALAVAGLERPWWVYLLPLALFFRNAFTQALQWPRHFPLFNLLPRAYLLNIKPFQIMPTLHVLSFKLQPLIRDPSGGILNEL